MRRADIKVLKPAAQHRAESKEARDELCEIASALDLAALAAIGMAEDLGGEEGDLLGNYLREQAMKLRYVSERLSPIDMEATTRKIEEVRS